MYACLFRWEVVTGLMDGDVAVLVGLSAPAASKLVTTLQDDRGEPRSPKLVSLAEQRHHDANHIVA